MTVNDLKSCPFCGGKAMLYVSSGAGLYISKSYVYCKECRAASRTFASYNTVESKASAMKAWNRRVGDSD